MKTTIRHPSLGVEATVHITQDTTEAFGELWEVGEKPVKMRKYYKKMVDSSVAAGMVVIHSPELPLGEWAPNQVQWLAVKVNELFMEATTVPPE